MVLHTLNAEYQPNHASLIADDGSVDFLQESNHATPTTLHSKVAADAIPTKQLRSQGVIITPDRLSRSSIDSSSSTGSFSDEDLSKGPIKTAHKIREEMGFEKPEPLLVENPRRFVLFPIQDNEVCVMALVSIV